MKKTRHYGAPCNAEIVGNFVVRKSLDFAECEHGAMFWGERGDRTFKALVAFLVLEILPRIARRNRFGCGRDAIATCIGIGAGGVGEKRNEAIEPALSSPQMIDCAPGG